MSVFRFKGKYLSLARTRLGYHEFGLAVLGLIFYGGLRNYRVPAVIVIVIVVAVALRGVRGVASRIQGIAILRLALALLVFVLLFNHDEHTAAQVYAQRVLALALILFALGAVRARHGVFVAVLDHNAFKRIGHFALAVLELALLEGLVVIYRAAVAALAQRVGIAYLHHIPVFGVSSAVLAARHGISFAGGQALHYLHVAVYLLNVLRVTVVCGPARNCAHCGGSFRLHPAEHCQGRCGGKAVDLVGCAQFAEDVAGVGRSGGGVTVVAAQHQRYKRAHGYHRGKPAAHCYYHSVAALCLHRAQAYFLFAVYAHAVLYLFFQLIVGQDLLRAVFKHLFNVHRPPSFLRCAFSFFKASLFFHVTVPIGMPSICATSRRLYPATWHSISISYSSSLSSFAARSNI